MYKEYVFDRLNRNYYYDILHSRYYFVRAESILTLEYYKKKDQSKRIFSVSDNVTKKKSAEAISRAKLKNISAVFASDSISMVFCIYIIGRNFKFPNLSDEIFKIPNVIVLFIEPDIIKDSLTKTKIYSENEVIINPDTSKAILYSDWRMIERLTSFMYIFSPVGADYLKNYKLAAKFYEHYIEELDNILLAFLCEKYKKQDLKRLIEICAYSVIVKLALITYPDLDYTGFISLHASNVVLADENSIPSYIKNKQKYVKTIKKYMSDFIRNPRSYEVEVPDKNYRSIQDMNEIIVYKKDSPIRDISEIYVKIRTYEKLNFVEIPCRILLA